jgi:YHS domain-containing protein
MKGVILMTRIGFFMGAVILAFVLATANTTTFANSCCGAKKDDKESNMKDAKDCAKKVSAGESSGDKCLVCGQAADSKGKQVDTKHAGETVHLCCEGCLNAYNQNPDKYSETKKRRVPIKKNERSSAY